MTGKSTPNRVMVAVDEDFHMQRGDTFLWFAQVSESFREKLEGRSGLWFTLKHSSDDTEEEARIQITEGGGLIRLNGVVPSNPQWGSLDITDEDNGIIYVVIDAQATALLTSYNSHWFYDFQARKNGVVVTIKRGRTYIIRDYTRVV